ncbi:MAG: hypothetical protein OXB88_11520 [Bacteriovoracales bacterium]|nr:hypothetical protein [Bacteriovoracales bacterium]
MKNRISVNAFNLFLLLVFLLWPIYAISDEYGVVTSLKGKAFGLYNDQTFTLKEGYKLPEEVEIMTEVGGSISFTDRYHRKYELSGSAHVKLMGHGLKLSRGHLWVRSSERSKRLFINTPNAQAEILSGEGILSFDHSNGKSQLLGLKGQFKFAHFLDVNRYEILHPGEFSVIDPESEAPRRSTPIGFESYEKVIALFRGSRGDSSGATPGRFLASKKGSLRRGQMVQMKKDLRNLYFKGEGTIQRGGAAVSKRPHEKGSHVQTQIISFGNALEKSASPLPSPSPLPSEGGEEGVLKLKARAPSSLEIDGGGPPTPWGLESAMRKHLRKTFRHKLEREGMIEDLRDYRRGYKINN